MGKIEVESMDDTMAARTVARMVRMSEQMKAGPWDLTSAAGTVGWWVV